MSLLQKWLAGMVALGAIYLVATNPDAIYKGASAFRNATAGSIVDITTGGKK